MALIEKPAPDLTGQIEMFWSVSGEKGRGKAYYEILPTCDMNLVLRFSASGARMVLLGPLTEKTCVEIDEASEYCGVAFHSSQVPGLLDAHPAELVDRAVDLSGFGGEGVGSLAERLLGLPDLAARNRVLEGLVRRGAAPLVRDARCRRAAALLEASGGRLRIRELASGLGLTGRSLERLFREHLGIPPKQLARLVRFRCLVSGLRERGCTSLADLACACGYADQSHMIKDFKELSGRLPGETAACEMRRVAGMPQVKLIHGHR